MMQVLYRGYEPPPDKSTVASITTDCELDRDLSALNTQTVTVPSDRGLPICYTV